MSKPNSKLILMTILFKTVLAILVLSAEAFSQVYWLKQQSPTVNNLTSCFFADTLNGWISGDSGLILHTSDKGQNWIFQNSGINDEVVSLFFVNKNIGYGLALEFDKTPPNHYGTRILTTTNGGNVWNNYLFPDTNVFLNSIFFLDSLNGFLAGSGGKLFYTNNSGSNWIEGVIDSGLSVGFPVEKIKFYNVDIGYASGGAFDIAGVMWNSTNGGRSWRTKIVGAEPIYDFHIFDSLNVIGVGGDFEYGASKIRSFDGGGLWNYSELGVFGIANSIGFRTETEAWSSLGIVDSFLYSTNSGDSWSLIGTPDGIRINDLVFVNSINGWAVGKEGAILKFNPDIVSVSEESDNLPGKFSLHQNYPNPFNPNTIINYELRITGYVSLKIFDVQGKEIISLINQQQPPGKYEVKFDGTNFPSGIYFYRLEFNGFILAKKMLLIK